MPQSIPVCMFHHVNEHVNDAITVSVPHFRSMMAMLQREGYTTLSSEAFRAHMLRQWTAPSRSVLLTFDDAWLDVFACAYPVMKSYGHRFTVFVVSDYADRAAQYGRKAMPTHFLRHREARRLLDTPAIGEVMCNWDDLAEMVRSGLCSVENHTATHGKLEVREDIARGRTRIQEMLGVPASQLCWPKGKHDARALAAARDLGIDVTYLVRRGVNLAGFGMKRIKRFTVEDRDAGWLKHQLEIFSRPLYGYLYSRIKPDRMMRF